MVDYHIHSNFSLDSSEKLENILNTAVKKNLDEIMLTDHFDFDCNGNLIRGSYSFEEYIENFNHYKEKYKDKIKFKLGMELGVEPHIKESVKKLLSKAEFEFIIGSSHNTDKIELYTSEYFYGKDKYTAYYGYFKEILENIKLFEEISVYGHFDYIERYGTYVDNKVYYKEFKDIIDEIIIELISRGKGFEVNVSGFRYGLNTVHPQLEILKRYKELGGEILTIGSDAHSAHYIGKNFDKSLGIIKEAGFTRLTKFSHLKPIFFDI